MCGHTILPDLLVLLCRGLSYRVFISASEGTPIYTCLPSAGHRFDQQYRLLDCQVHCRPSVRFLTGQWADDRRRSRPPCLRAGTTARPASSAAILGYSSDTWRVVTSRASRGLKVSEPRPVLRRRQYWARCGQLMFEYYCSPDGHFGLAESFDGAGHEQVLRTRQVARSRARTLFGLCAKQLRTTDPVT
jgi:hypothetical protein